MIEIYTSKILHKQQKAAKWDDSDLQNDSGCKVSYGCSLNCEFSSKVCKVCTTKRFLGCTDDVWGIILSNRVQIIFKGSRRVASNG